MPLTKTGTTAIKGTILIVIAVAAGGLAYGETVNARNVATIAQRPLPVVTKIVIATPTVEPTASPSAVLKPRVTIATPKVTHKVTK